MTSVEEIKNIQRIRKIVILGDEGVGKTCFLKTLKQGKFESTYIPTESNYLKLSTIEYKGIFYNIIDSAGQEKYQTVISNMDKWVDIDLFIVMFDLTNLLSYKNVRWWLDKVRSTFFYTPIVLVGSKSDCNKRLCNITLQKKYKIPYVEISSKTKHGFGLVLLCMTGIDRIK